MVKSTIKDEVATTAQLLNKKPKRWAQPPVLTEHGPATVLAVVNQKGGQRNRGVRGDASAVWQPRRD